MKLKRVAALGAALVSFSLPFATHAQQTTSAGNGLTYPWQRSFWGYAGVGGGRAAYDVTCGPAPLACDDDARAFRIFAGGKINRYFGAEASYLDLGHAHNNGGDIEAKGLNLSLLAGYPFGVRGDSMVFAKVGLTFGRTDTSAAIPGIATGKENDVDGSYGAGLMMGITDTWAARVDFDRLRFKFATDRREVDTWTVGLQRRF